MRSTKAVWLGLTLLATGCGAQKDAAPAAAQKARPTAIREQAISAALTASEVRAFLKLLPALPRGEAPEFGASGISEPSEQLTAVEMAGRWKREFRSAYQAETQARLWRDQRRLCDSLLDAGVEPQSLASLLVRLSTAVARDALDPRIDLTSELQKADRRVLSLCQRIDQLPEPSTAPAERRLELVGTRKGLAEELREAVAFREFLQLLRQVPEESLLVIREYRTQLKQHLPTVDTIQAFERRMEGEAEVIPASRIAPAAER